MTLQPMTTAPRDGREVLLYFRSRVSGRRKCIAEWDSASERWSLCGISLTDAAFSGWLEVEALERDSERLNWMQEHEKPMLVDGDPCGLAAVITHHVELTLREAIDAAIDKEMGRA